MNVNQRPKMSVYIATSIDGYIAKINDGLDWSESFNPPSDNPDNVLHESWCRLLSSKSYSNDLVQLHYEIAKQ